jgi:hypothetical protein
VICDSKRGSISCYCCWQRRQYTFLRPGCSLRRNRNSAVCLSRFRRGLDSRRSSPLTDQIHSRPCSVGQTRYPPYPTGQIRSRPYLAGQIRFHPYPIGQRRPRPYSRSLTSRNCLDPDLSPVDLVLAHQGPSSSNPAELPSHSHG